MNTGVKQHPMLAAACAAGVIVCTGIALTSHLSTSGMAAGGAVILCLVMMGILYATPQPSAQFPVLIREHLEGKVVEQLEALPWLNTGEIRWLPSGVGVRHIPSDDLYEVFWQEELPGRTYLKTMLRVNTGSDEFTLSGWTDATPHSALSNRDTTVFDIAENSQIPRRPPAVQELDELLRRLTTSAIPIEA